MLSPSQADELAALRLIDKEDFPVPIPFEAALQVLIQAGHVLKAPSGLHLSDTGRVLLSAYRD